MTNFDTVLASQIEAPLDLTNKTVDEALAERCATNKMWHILFETEAEMKKMPQCNSSVTHRFTPGMYIRECFMPKTSLVISQIHKTEHPFTISHGACMVWTLEDGVKLYKAPHTGITKPGTKRLLVMLEDTIWTTYHPTTLTNVEQIESEILFHPDVKQLSEDTL